MPRELDTTWEAFLQLHEVISQRLPNHALSASPSTYFQMLFWGAIRAYLLSNKWGYRDVVERQVENITYEYSIRPKFGGESLEYFARLQCVHAPALLILKSKVAEALKLEYSSLRVSVWNDDEISIYLDGGLPPTEILSWIDTSFEICLQNAQARELEFKSMEDGIPVDKNKLRKLISFCNLETRTNDIVSLLRSSLWIRRTIKGDISRGRSKFGGYPDLPPSLDYPTADGKPLAFIGQINLAELPLSPISAQLPPHGMIYFFSFWGWHELGEPKTWANPDRWRVLYYPNEALPQGSSVLPQMNGVDIFTESAIEFLPCLTLPDIRLYDQPTWTEAEKSRYYELYDRFIHLQQSAFSDAGHNDEPPTHLFRGYYQSIQFNYLPEEHTQLLLQVDYDPEIGFHWGDSGRLSFFISDEDLARRDFSKIHFEMESY